MFKVISSSVLIALFFSSSVHAASFDKQLGRPDVNQAVHSTEDSLLDSAIGAEGCSLLGSKDLGTLKSGGEGRKNEAHLGYLFFLECSDGARFVLQKIGEKRIEREGGGYSLITSAGIRDLDEKIAGYPAGYVTNRKEPKDLDARFSKLVWMADGGQKYGIITYGKALNESSKSKLASLMRRFAPRLDKR